MKIRFSSEKFGKICNRQELLVRKYGAERAKRICRRLDELDAAATLEDFRFLPGRCHELTGTWKGCFPWTWTDPIGSISVPPKIRHHRSLMAASIGRR